MSTLKPAHESVGPLAVLHDLDHGTLEVRDAITLEDILRSSPMPMSITALGAALGLPSIDRNEREQVSPQAPPARADARSRRARRPLTHRRQARVPLAVEGRMSKHEANHAPRRNPSKH